MTHKKINTLFFILAATIVNVLLMAMLFLLAYSVYQLMAGRYFSPGVNTFVIFLLFAGSVALTYFVHKTLVGLLLKRTRIGKYLHPAIQPMQKKETPPDAMDRTDSPPGPD
jgi:hypothetical protein